MRPPRQQPQYDGSERDFPFHLVVFPHNTLGDGEAAHLPWMQSTPDPLTSVTWQTWVEVNPKVADQMGLHEGDVVAVVSQHGRVEVPVYVYPAASPTVLAMPLGQGHAQGGRWARGRGVNPMTLVAPVEDQATGALAYGATRVRLEKTGRKVSLTKFEGNVPAFVSPDQTIIQVTRGA
jgi:menaquinone reductase, molybdopterin-binding-like subunit